MGLFSRKDKIDKYWDKFNKVLSHPKTTAKNAFMRLHNTTLLPGGMPLEFDLEEQEEFVQRYGVQFCELMASALTQDKINLDFASVLLRDYMNIEEMGYAPLEQEAFRRAYTNYIHVGLERCFSSKELDAAASEYFMAQNTIIYECMLDDTGGLTEDEVEQFILKLQDLAYEAKDKDERYSNELFSCVENLIEDREPTGLSYSCSRALLYKALYSNDVYGNGLFLKILDDVTYKERSNSSEANYKPLTTRLMTAAFNYSAMPNTDKAWLAYVLKVYGDVEDENMTVISGRHTLVDRCFPDTEDKEALSSVCVCFNAEATKQSDVEQVYIFSTEISALPCHTLQNLQGEDPDEKQLLTNYFNGSVKPSVYTLSDYKKMIPDTFGESGAVLVERIQDEQHLKKLQKLIIH